MLSILKCMLFFFNTYLFMFSLDFYTNTMLLCQHETKKKKCKLIWITNPEGIELTYTISEGKYQTQVYSSNCSASLVYARILCILYHIYIIYTRTYMISIKLLIMVYWIYKFNSWHVAMRMFNDVLKVNWLSTCLKN